MAHSVTDVTSEVLPEKNAIRELSDIVSGIADVEFNVDLRPYSSIGIDGTADAVVFPKTDEAIIKTILYCQQRGIPYYVSGLGADTVFGNIHGVLINTQSLDRFIEGENIIPADEVKTQDRVITAQAGVVWGRKPAIRPQDMDGLKYEDADALVNIYRKNKSMAWVALNNAISGVEGLADVPGTIGAGIYLNAGGGSDQFAAQYVEEVVLINSDGEVKRMKKGESRKTGLIGLIKRGKDTVQFGYRTSSLQEDGKIVYAVRFRFTETRGQGDIKEDMFREYESRFDYLPRGLSVGSVWKRRGYNGMGYGQDEGGNPIKGDKLVREAGCAGYIHPSRRIVVSEQYPLFLINLGGATQDDFRETMVYVERRVEESTGQKLVREVKFLPPL